MCGILAAFGKDNLGTKQLDDCHKALSFTKHRGPDNSDFFQADNIFLGHNRLSIIDLSNSANQPFFSDNKKHAIVFNGEIYNYQNLKKELEAKGLGFKTNSDTEVLLQMLKIEGISAINKINGFFAFVFVDFEKGSILAARDRIGIKPLYFYEDNHKLIFTSELHGLFELKIDKSIDSDSLFSFLQLNYIPAPNSILKNCKKLLPGHFVEFNYKTITKEATEITQRSYYKIPFDRSAILEASAKNFQDAQKQIQFLLEDAVKQRLTADVEVGTFLSGGIDSSIITALAAKNKNKLHSFSIGFPDNPFFDETKYANLLAKKWKTEHTVFQVTKNDFESHIYNVLDSIDEPFADASAIAVYILSKYTSQQIKVILSGDGADELFAGYNKHMGELKARMLSPMNTSVKLAGPLLNFMPSGRGNYAINKIRQAKRYSDGLRLSRKERYWKWASISDIEEANYILREKIMVHETRLSDKAHEFIKRRNLFTKHITKNGPFNEVLYADMHLVLPNDMLKKVDLMSMAHGLEVRTPFLDHRLVEYAFKVPSAFKIAPGQSKKILKTAFNDLLPQELLNRKKKGFEVPLHHFLINVLGHDIENKYLANEFIVQQKIFNPDAIKHLKKQLFSKNPKDSANKIWALVVFQHWFLKHY